MSLSIPVMFSDLGRGLQTRAVIGQAVWQHCNSVVSGSTAHLWTAWDHYASAGGLGSLRISCDLGQTTIVTIPFRVIAM